MVSECSLKYQKMDSCMLSFHPWLWRWNQKMLSSNMALFLHISIFSFLLSYLFSFVHSFLAAVRFATCLPRDFLLSTNKCPSSVHLNCSFPSIFSLYLFLNLLSNGTKNPKEGTPTSQESQDGSARTPQDFW